MAYNFELTFTQPILTQLDNGTIGGAEDWANAVTKAYVNTIKMGLPLGVVPVLPAPGLNPLAPPPFAIGVSSYTTANVRSKQMYNVIYAYYYAKELKLDKGGIEGLIATIKQLLVKLKATQGQIKTYIDMLKTLTEELKELPKLLTDIIKGIQDYIREQVENVKNIASSLDNAKLQLGSVNFARVFTEELSLINTIKNFKITDVGAVRELTLFVSDYGKRTNNLLAVTTSETLMKKYVKDKLFGIASEFLELAKGVIDPTKILQFVKQIATTKQSVKKLLAKVERFDFVVRYIQPKIRKLEIKKQEKVNEIKNRIQLKLIELRKKLDQKIVEYSEKKKKGKALRLYTKAKKTIDDFKKTNELKIKKVRKIIKLLRKAFKEITVIVGKSIALKDGLKIEFDNIKNEIESLQKKIKERGVQVGSLNSPNITFPNMSGELNPKQIIEQIAQLKEYFNNSGLGEFGNIAALIITQTKCDFQTFKSFFEKRNSKLKQYVMEFYDLDANIRGLAETLRQIITDVSPNQSPKQGNSDWLTDRIKSLKDLLSIVIRKLEPKLIKIQAWIEAKIKQLTTYITKELTKFSEQLKTFAINLIPIKSDTQDKKTKKEAQEYKILQVKAKIEEIRAILKLVSFVSKIVKGSLKVAANLTKGKYKYTENELPINDIIDGYFMFKMENQSKSTQAQLMTEKILLKQRFKALLIIELLATGLIETFKDIKTTDFVKILKEDIASMGTNVPGKQTLEALQNIINNPPKNPKEFKDLGNILALDVLRDISVATKIVGLEKRYLNKSRELIKSLCDIKQLEGTNFEATILKIKNTLDKNQSFILLAFELLGKELAKFDIFLRKKIQEVIKPIKDKLQKRKDKVQERAEKELKNRRERLVNVDAFIMSFTFGLAARTFWTGASWQGPTGTTHTVFNIGAFKPIKILPGDGASVMIRDMAKSFERQLYTLQGIATPPPPTGIPPQPINGYK
jgi:hypothetical protein